MDTWIALRYTTGLLPDSVTHYFWRYSVAECTYIHYIVTKDKASQALAQGADAGVPTSFRAIADHSGIPKYTLHRRARGRRSIESKAISQHYLAPYEEKAVVEFILQMAGLGTPVRMKYTPAIAFSATRHRSEGDRPSKPPGPNWAKALENRNPELRAKRVKALDWNRHEEISMRRLNIGSGRSRRC